MPRKTLKKGQPLGNEKMPDLGSVTPKALEVFERGLAEKKYAQEKVETYASKPRPTIRELLLLAWFRNWLSLLEPKLPDGNSPTTAAGVWQYWVDHPDELRELSSLWQEIISYLETKDRIEADKIRSNAAMHDLIRTDPFTHLALYPVVEEMARKSSGRPVARPQVAVRALQLKIDSGRTWQEITDEVCDCGQSVHGEFCKPNLRQSIRALERLLKKCGIKVPTT